MTMTTAQRWVLALTSLASLMILLDALVVTTALHAIAVDLHAPSLGWLIATRAVQGIGAAAVALIASMRGRTARR